MASPTKTTGQQGEFMAEKFLKKQGYKIIERNWSHQGWAEIDLVALENNQLVFVEVKTRVGTRYGYPEEAVDSRKLHALKRSGQLYASQNEGRNLPSSMRIDVVAVILDEADSSQAKEIQLFLV